MIWLAVIIHPTASPNIMCVSLFTGRLPLSSLVTEEPLVSLISLLPLSCSLMEGLGGTICLHCDLLHPEMATFPGYEGDI